MPVQLDGDAAGAVHAAFGIRGDPRAFMPVVGIARVSQIEGLELDFYVAALAELDQVRAWQLVLTGKGVASEHIVRTAVFLYHNNHMLNLRDVVVLGVGECRRK